VPKSLLSRLKNKLVIGLALGGLVFIGLSLYSDFNKLLESFRSFHWAFAPLLLVLSFSNYIIRFFKWDYYLKVLKIHLPKRDSAVCFFTGLVMTISPGKMGEVLKSYFLKQLNGTPFSVSAPIVVAERLTDFLALVILCAGGIFVATFSREVWAIVIVVIFIASFLIVIGSRKLSLGIISLMERWGPIAKIGHKLRAAYESTYAMVRFRHLLVATLLSVAAWFCECCGLYVTLLSFQGNSGILLVTFIYALSTMAGAITMLPGGLGATEVSMAALIAKMADVAKNDAIAATLIIRAATLWFAVLVGAVVLIASQKRFEKVGEYFEEGLKE